MLKSCILRDLTLIMLFLTSLMLGMAVRVEAQGVLISSGQRLPRVIIIHPPFPPRPQPPVIIRPEPVQVLTYSITGLEVDAKLKGQVADVQVSQTFQNTGTSQIEVSFMFPLPYNGAIDQLTLMVDGKELPGKLMAADKARGIYEEIVRKNRDPALLEWVGTGMFRTNVFPIPAGERRTVTLRYTQLCRMSDGLTDFLFPLSTAKYTEKPVEKISVRLKIESQEEIRNIYSPAQDIKIEKTGGKYATVIWEAKNTVPTTDFRLFYDVGTKKVVTSLLSYRPESTEDGYFLLLTNPKIERREEKPLPKTVMFVIDKSGSMSGKKMEQVRDALKFVINNLREGDLFNIISYDSRLDMFCPELERFTEETRKKALEYASGLYAGGGTDINTALVTALNQFQDKKRPNYLFFLTDGCPTVGECNEMKIVENMKNANKIGARIFAFGAGYDLNSRLLDKLVRSTFGQSEYVQPQEDIEERVSMLFRKMEAPVLTCVEMEFIADKKSEAKKNDTPLVNRVYPSGKIDLFAGEQLVITGRYKYPGKGKLVVKGHIGDKVEKYEFPINLVEKSSDSSMGFAEKLWALRRIGEILDELDLHGKNQELVDELVMLSIKHGILTPYTSFLADETVALHDKDSNSRIVDTNVMALKKSSGYAGVAQRAMKGSMQRANVISPMEAQADAFEMESVAVDAGGIRSAEAPVTMGRPGTGKFLARDKSEAKKTVSDSKFARNNLRQIGNRSFFMKNGQWIDSSLTETQQVQKPVNVKQFSEAYFELVRKNQEIAPFLTMDEPILLRIGDQAYLIEP